MDVDDEDELTVIDAFDVTLVVIDDDEVGLDMTVEIEQRDECEPVE